MCHVLYAACTLAEVDAADGLVQLSRLVLAAYSDASARHGLTPVQARLLCVLATGPRGMAELATCFGVEKAALTGLVDRAERRGLVRRAAVPDDRRAVRVMLTPDGSSAATAFHAEADAAVERLLEPLAPDERRTFRELLETVVRSSGGCGG